ARTTVLGPPSVHFPTTRPPPRPTLFPYTTLFRSQRRPAWPTPICPTTRATARTSTPRLPRRRDWRKSSVWIPAWCPTPFPVERRSEEHTSELQSRENLVCRLLLEKTNSDGTSNTN